MEGNDAAKQAEQNLKDIRKWAKDEKNTICADCKRNKHPRWTSYELGVFVCIRCSGIHRGMGVHISRVKSVDLDSWKTDQVKTMQRWGNKRANMYWEAKLAPGHVPSDAKIENFIRTKYETKRWVMDGGKPEPETLDDGREDNVPLNIVQEKAKLARESSLRAASTSSQPVPPPPKPNPPIDLFDDVPPPPARPSTTDTPISKPPPPKTTAAPKQTKAADSLLGLDFFGAPPPATSVRPSSSASTPSGSAVPSRKDLSNSILSLYSMPSKSQPPTQHERQPSMGTMQSPPIQQASMGGLGGAFSDLNFNPATSPPVAAPQQQPKSDPFAGFNTAASQRSSAAPPKVTSPTFGGGGFFNPGPKATPKPPAAVKPPQVPTPKADPLLSDDFGAFNFASPSTSAPPKPTTVSASNDLFDFSEPSPPAWAPPPSKPAPQKSSAPISSPNVNSAFNLSAPAPPSQSATQKAVAPQPAAAKPSSAFSNMDAWGSSDAWATPEPTSTSTAPPPKPAAPAKAPSISMSNDFSAWGGAPASSNPQPSAFSNGFSSTSQPTPKVAPDEDFGGWSSAAPATPATSKPTPQASKPAGGGFGGSDDLFSNVWE